MSGISAGAICWFNFGNSDSRKFKNPEADLIKIKGLGLINALFCPHYDVEKERESELKKMMKKTSDVAIAIKNCCAIEIIDNKYRVVSSKKTANAYKIYWKNGNFKGEIMVKEKNLKPLKGLLKK